MRPISHYTIIAFLAVCTALMVVLLFAQDDDEEYTYVMEECEDEEDTWS